MRAKSLSINYIRYKTLIWHDSKSMVRWVKNSRRREFSQTIPVSIHDNKFIWRKKLKMFKDTI
jgi:hypothetical protein